MAGHLRGLALLDGVVARLIRDDVVERVKPDPDSCTSRSTSLLAAHKETVWRADIRQDVVMQTWAGLVGVIAGAALALLGQHVIRRSDAHERLGLLLLEQCSLLVALSEDYRNRVWEERKGLSEDAVARWDLGAYRLAQARLKILCRDKAILDAVVELQESGTAIGKSWRLSRQDGPEVQAAWERHKLALANFIEVSSNLVGTTSRPVSSL